MAKLTAPFLSLGASGKLADTLVAFSWKGINVVRQYVRPSNPQTAAQTTQRGYFTDAVAAWRNYFTAASGRSAWNRLALQLAETMSGFNAFMRSAIGMASTDADASFADTIAADTGNVVDFTMKNMDDGATGDEAGNFEVWVGDQPGSLLNLETKAIVAGVITTSDLGDTDDVKYVKLRKDGYDRSGIAKITLIA